MFKYISMHLKSQLEYKSSFIFLIIAQIAAFFGYCVVFYSLFAKFGLVKSFNIYQVILCFAVVQFGENFAEGLLRGFDKFSEIIKHGHLDQLLVRPQNIYLQIIGYKIELSKLIKCVISLIILGYALIKLKIKLIYYPVILMMMLGSTIVFGAFLILSAAMCFVTIEGLEVINIFIYGTRDFAQYPIGIYNKIVKTFFTYIVPIGLTSYYPMLYITGSSDRWWYILLPILSLITLIPACLTFNAGMRKYKSTGS
ncbi:MAG: ABC-2 family transporter protein [Clostridia bacterium]|nr:ABC-2 family transporter protein [Clostridia bacterium]